METLTQTERQRPAWWVPVSTSSLHEVSRQGKIRNKKTKELLVPHVYGKGYLAVTLGRENHRYVHRIVLESFIGPCPPGHETRHLNGDRTDNRLCNLCWGTKRENERDKYTHGTRPLGEKTWNARISDAVAKKIKQDPRPMKVIAREYGLRYHYVYMVKRTWQSAGNAVKSARSCVGEEHRCSKLTEAQVLAIRADTRTQKALAKEYGVVQSVISAIKLRKKWKHLP